MLCSNIPNQKKKKKKKSLTNVGGIYKKLGLHNQAERKANSNSAIIQKLIHSIDWLLLWIQSSYLLSQNGKKLRGKHKFSL